MELPSPLVLAYLGDAVLELYVRKRLVAAGPAPVRALHRAATRRVSAAAQAAVWDKLQNELTPEEAGVARRARNARPARPARGSEPEHHLSTALEAVLGYLYLLDEQERLHQLLDRIWELGETASLEKPI